jgi:hypothetical protein
MNKRVILAKRARKGEAPPPPANRHERRAPLDGAAVMAALADIKAALATILSELRKGERP